MHINSVLQSLPDVAGASTEALGGALVENAAELTWDYGVRTSPQSHILIIDNEPINRRLLKATLKSPAYRIFECRQASEAIELLESERIDAIVLELMLPQMSGPDLCRWLKSNRKTRFIPLLMLTSIQGIENEIAGISSGADEFLIKPLHPAVVRARIEAMLRNKAVIDSLEEAETILFALAQAVEQRDKFTGRHCERLAASSVRMGHELNLPEHDLTALYRGGFLHDIGKISTPDAILFKPGKLTPDEWEIMRNHTTQGERICSPMKSLAAVLPIIRSHHEKMDGSGYPDGLAGEQIPLLARILQTVDIYDALTSARSYKPALNPDEAIQIMREEARCGWRDPILVELFARMIREDGNEPGEHSMHTSIVNMRAQLLS